MNLMPDITYLYQFGIFVFAFIMLNFLVFRPLVKLIERRRALTEATLGESEDLRSKTQRMIEQYESRLQAGQQEGLRLKAELKKNGELQAQERLKTAREAGETQLTQGMLEIRQQLNQAQDQLKKQAEQLSEQWVEKVLGRKAA